MKFEYNPVDVQFGTQVKLQLEERPTSLITESGVTNAVPDQNLVATNRNKTRMAGQMGERALALMNDPAVAQATDTWMGMFDQSNEGMQFNQAKQQTAAMQAGAQMPQEA